jgi:hypothetical protein
MPLINNFSVGHRNDIDFNRVVQEAIKRHRKTFREVLDIAAASRM